jgi:cutinase
VPLKRLRHSLITFALVAFAAPAAVLAPALSPMPFGPLPTASAQDCPDIEVVFARGTNDAPGLGNVGEAFVDSLRGKVGGRSVGA